MNSTETIKNKNKKQPFSRLLLIAPFLLILVVPLIGPKETKSLEKRTLAPAPGFNIEDIWSTFFEFDRYFTDRFAFRNIAVSTIGKIKYDVLGISPVPQLVTNAKEDWLFYTHPDVVKDANTPFTDLELKKIKLNLEIITKWLKQRNIKYYFTIPPFKSRIYPEMMTDELKLRFAYSKINQVYDYLKNDTSIRLIDFRNELMEGKKIRPTYLKTDTHWTFYGAFIAYTKIMERIKKDFPQVSIKPISDYTIDSATINGGDLQVMMGINDEIHFTAYYLNEKNKVNFISIDSTTIDPHPGKYSVREMPDKTSGLKLFVVRDSYTEYLKKFLTPSFDRSFYAWMTNPPITMIVKEQPNIVLHEILEQFIDYTLILPEEIKADTAFLKTNFPEYLSIQ